MTSLGTRGLLAAVARLPNGFTFGRLLPSVRHPVLHILLILIALIFCGELAEFAPSITAEEGKKSEVEYIQEAAGLNFTLTASVSSGGTPSLPVFAYINFLKALALVAPALGILFLSFPCLFRTVDPRSVWKSSLSPPGFFNLA